MKGKELIYQISGKSYIDVYLIAGNRIIDRLIEVDKIGRASCRERV